MSFNMNLEETTRLLKEATKRRQLQDASKEFDEIKKHTLVLTEEEQKSIDAEAVDLSKVQVQEKKDKLSECVCQLNEEDIKEVQTKVENIMPYINESIDE